jgi:urease subunit beta
MPMIPGEYLLRNDDIIANEGRESIRISVINTGDRPVQIGSHFHFFEVNKSMQFERERAYGRRLDIPSGTAVRFEPGEEKEICLVEIGGKRFVAGFSNLVDGHLSEANKEKALTDINDRGFKNETI